jgi:Leucine-rich repeat (LRR) protein
MIYPSSAGNDASYSFHLSPLADFTVNQIDDPLHLELSYIAQRTQPSSLRQVHGTFALAAEDLVKHITDVEPYEPYWEHIRRLNLRDKGLITLHRLNEFCCHLEELDVSGNELGQLSGAPSALRDLRVQRNCISSLTAWGHLVNLQYLDVSGNHLESLDGFSGLIHLRELRANNNKIRNIDGVLDLNGLLRLELRRNELTMVDFEGSELYVLFPYVLLSAVSGDFADT